MTLPPGSVAWLLAHEVRLAARNFVARRTRRRGGGLWLLVGVPAVLALAAGVPLGRVLREVQIQPIPAAFAIADLGVAMVFTLMLSQTLAAAVEALYERGDLELLFSSPIAPAKVVAVRFLGVAVTVTGVFAFFAAPLLVPIALIGHPAWLAAFGVLLATGLAASGVGLALASGLFRLIGPRRTRTIAQLLAAVIGAAFFLVAQARNLLGAGRSRSLMQAVAHAASQPAFRLAPGADWPLRAMTGEPLPLLAMLAAGAAVFAVAAWGVGRGFAADAAAAAGAGATASGGARRTVRAHAFARGAVLATLRKELRLLVRDPALLAQVLLRVLYLLPLAFVLVRQAAHREALLLPGGAAALAVLASQVAGTMVWITVSAEDAPELLAAAPAPARLVRRGKLIAALLPVAVLLAPILLALAALAPWTAFAASLGCAAALASSALLNVWWQSPARRSEMRTRRSGSLGLAMAELAVSLLIAAATGLVAARLAWGVIPAALAAALLALMRRSEAQIAERLQIA